MLYQPIPPFQMLCFGQSCEMHSTETAYGQRLNCVTHHRVWTRLRVDGLCVGQPWVEEKYSGPEQMTHG